MSDVGPLVGAPPWMMAAHRDYGEREFSPGDNPRIIEYLRFSKVPLDELTDSVAWCGASLGFWMHVTGFEPPAKCYRASSWEAWGEPCEPERLGAILVVRFRNAPASLTRSGKHVTMRLGDSPTSIFALGGNQGNSVKASRYSKELCDIIASRWPKGHPR